MFLSGTLTGYLSSSSVGGTTAKNRLKLNGQMSSLLFSGTLNGKLFIQYIKQLLSQILKEGDIVILDNCAAHKIAGKKSAISAFITAGLFWLLFWYDCYLRPLLQERQSRPLEKWYPFVFMDAIHYKVREEKQLVSKAAYVVLEVNKDGYKEVLGILIGQAESSKFWLSVLNELRNRGIQNVNVLCVTG